MTDQDVPKSSKTTSCAKWILQSVLKSLSFGNTMELAMVLIGTSNPQLHYQLSEAS